MCGLINTYVLSKEIAMFKNTIYLSSEGLHMKPHHRQLFIDILTF